MGYSINTENYHYIEWYDWYPKKGQRGDFKIAELYDAIKDPSETNNLAVEENYAELMKQLSTQLAEGWKKAVPK